MNGSLKAQSKSFDVECLCLVWHVLKPGTTGTKPPEQPERNHRNHRNDRNKNRKRPEPPKPKSNMEFHILDLPTCISRPILRIYVIVNS
jgi:hypothetical protein